MIMKILDRYIDQLLESSTPQAPVWNIEKIHSGQTSTWNYIDGCMIKASWNCTILQRTESYLEFADSFIDYFVNEDGSIDSYDPEEYNLDNVNAGKTLFDLYELTGKSQVPPGHGHHLRPVKGTAPHFYRKLLAQNNLPQPDLAGRPLYGPAFLHAVRGRLQWLQKLPRFLPAVSPCVQPHA